MVVVVVVVVVFVVLIILIPLSREREFMMCALKMEDESVFCETFSKSSLETWNVSSTVLPGTNNNKNNSNNVSSSSSTSKE